jgi:hypothetical protein
VQVSDTAHTLQVTVSDPNPPILFLCAGPRNETRALPPRQDVQLTLTLVRTAPRVAVVGIRRCSDLRRWCPCFLTRACCLVLLWHERAGAIIVRVVAFAADCH